MPKAFAPWKTRRRATPELPGVPTAGACRRCRRLARRPGFLLQSQTVRGWISPPPTCCPMRCPYTLLLQKHAVYGVYGFFDIGVVQSLQELGKGLVICLGNLEA